MKHKVIASIIGNTDDFYFKIATVDTDYEIRTKPNCDIVSIRPMPDAETISIFRETIVNYVRDYDNEE